jgi:5-methylcytosine-specific restriction protein A
MPQFPPTLKAFRPPTPYIKKEWKKRPSTSQRGYGKAWQKLRLEILSRDNYRCFVPNCRTMANEVDHIIALSKGGNNNPRNLRSCCKSHHSQKTALEDNPKGFNR